jgi:hypothetical protein
MKGLDISYRCCTKVGFRDSLVVVECRVTMDTNIGPDVSIISDRTIEMPRPAFAQANIWFATLVWFRRLARISFDARSQRHVLNWNVSVITFGLTFEAVSPVSRAAVGLLELTTGQVLPDTDTDRRCPVSPYPFQDLLQKV